MLVKDSRLTETVFYTQSKVLLMCPTWKIFNLFLTWKDHVQDFERLLFTLVLLHESSLSSWSFKTCWKPSYWKTTQLRVSELDIPRKVIHIHGFLPLWICSQPNSRTNRGEALSCYQSSKPNKLGCFSKVESTSFMLYAEDCHCMEDISAAGSGKIK